MVGKKHLYLTVTTSILGFMLAIQFQTVSEPETRDTRDTWELREDLMAEKEIESELYREIRANEDKLSKYENERQHSKEQLLKETLEELKLEAGLTDITGSGIVLTLRPIINELGREVPSISVSSSLLQRLINELNRYGAQHISIDNQRIINTTVIREITNVTKINGHTLNRFPIHINVIVGSPDDAENLYNRMKVSTVVDDFFIDNLFVDLDNPDADIAVPAYHETIRVRHLEPVQIDVGGDK